MRKITSDTALADLQLTDMLRGDTSALLDLVTRIKSYGVIAGGYAKWTIDPKGDEFRAGDIDIWPAGGSADNYEAIKSIIENELGFELFFDSDMSLNYAIPKDIDLSCTKMQLIKPRPEFAYEYIKDLLDIFDISVVKVAVVYSGGRLHAASRLITREHLKDRLATITNIKNPMASLVRIQKYQMQGFYFPIRELVKILAHTHAHTEQTIEILKAADTRNSNVTSTDLYRLMCRV